MTKFKQERIPENMNREKSFSVESLVIKSNVTK